MTQIKIEHIEKAFGERMILQDTSLHLTAGSRIGVVGPNGSGKTTFLKMIAGLVMPDRGQIKISGGGSLGLLEQNCKAVENTSAAFFSLLKRFKGDVREDWDHLSFGERQKLALADVLASAPHILLLDEPTNHLDFVGAESLIGFLEDYEGILLCVSHDRYFLDRTVTGILELQAGKITAYQGNYSAYKSLKEKRFQESLTQYENEKKEQERIKEAIRQKKGWAEKAHRESTRPDQSGNKQGVKEHRRVKAKKFDNQVKSSVKKLEKRIKAGGKRPLEEKSVVFSLEGKARQGRCLLRAEGLTKAFGENRLFTQSDFYILQGEKAAIFGPNGSGKTTLIRMLLGETPADAGELWLSPAVKPFLLSQENADLPWEKTVAEMLTQKRGILSWQDRTDLQNLGITKEHLQQKLLTLSMGECLRIRLIEAIWDQKDLLFLDEPTNHLDLPAREQMEKTLAAYEGTLLIASHDIVLLAKICDKVLWFDGGRLQRLEIPFAEFWQSQKAGNR